MKGQLDPEMQTLDAIPELAPTPFPFRGHRDFRGFTKDDHDNWAGGIFQKVSNPNEAKWIGGEALMPAALIKLCSLGYVVKVQGPHVSEIGNSTDGYERVVTHRYSLWFTTKTKHEITEEMRMLEQLSGA